MLHRHLGSVKIPKQQPTLTHLQQSHSLLSSFQFHSFLIVVLGLSQLGSFLLIDYHFFSMQRAKKDSPTVMLDETLSAQRQGRSTAGSI